LINNRQGGRRRGRGGQRGQNLGGNRQDNRQRGNAAQLLEKYKNMARDAQLAGDRVQSEYYLQFADHYFRVLGENRARFEEQRQQRGDDSSDEDDNEGEEEAAEASDDNHEDDRPRQRANGRDRSRRNDRNDRNDRNGARHVESDEGGEERIPMAALPPAIGRDGDDDEAPAKPKRRTRKPRSGDGDEAEIAPAA
jgi:hypothetical protein